MEEDAAYLLALVNLLRAIGIYLGHGFGNGVIRGDHAQRSQCLDQFDMILPGSKDRLLRLPLLPGLSSCPHPIEQYRLPTIADASVPDFETLLL